MTNRVKNDEHPIEIWAKIKAVMIMDFVSNYYHRESHQKLRQSKCGRLFLGVGDPHAKGKY